MKWFRDLIARIDGFSGEEAKAQEPSADIEEGEEVIGEVPTGLRSLYMYRGTVIDRLNEMKENHRKDHDDPNHTEEMCKEFVSSATALIDELEITERVFWRCLKEEAGIHADNIGIRKGWAVVKVKRKTRGAIIEVVSMSGPMSLADILRM